MDTVVTAGLGYLMLGLALAYSARTLVTGEFRLLLYVALVVLGPAWVAWFLAETAVEMWQEPGLGFRRAGLRVVTRHERRK